MFALFISALNQAIAADELAKKAQAILKERCFSCHGESGANEGGFNFVLNRKRLVRELVVPGDADASKLLDRIVKGEMPPDGDRVPKADAETLKKWIEAGAPAFATEAKRDFITLEAGATLPLKVLEALVDPEKSVLNELAGVVLVPHEGEGDRKGSSLMALHERPESRSVAFLRLCNESTVLFSLTYSCLLGV